MHLYIHGFGSSARSLKAERLMQHAQLRDQRLICPNLPTIPDLAIQTLEDWVIHTRPQVLIGSSLGGFYARYLASRFELPAVLINPAVNPDIRLREAIGQATQYFDGTGFEWTAQHCDALAQYQPSNEDQRRLWLLVQRGDEVLDAQQAINALPLARQTIEDGGDHGFQGFERYLDPLLDWRGY